MKECLTLKTIAVVTSGGDAPGMNAAIRAVTRIAHSRNLEVLGFERGWEGLLTNTFKHLTPRSVGGIIQLGGTMLHTLRCPEFEKEEGVEKAAETLALNNVDGLVVIGGDGSFRGALDLSRESDALMVGIPATIDNDVFGTDETIGFDTAVNTAVAAIDKIRDTAISHERIFIVEVMGRKRGFLALEVGIIVGAEGVGDTGKIAKELEKQYGSEVRLSILGYAQRGGSPSARSRLLASLFAEKAVDLLCQEQGNRVVGLQNGAIASIELEKSCETMKPLDLSLLKLADMLAI